MNKNISINEVKKEFELTEREFETNLNDIFGELSLCAKKPLKPTFVVVGGQSGSGKTALVAKEYQELKGNSVIIDQDEIRTKFPAEKYKRIKNNYTQREEYLILKPYISQMSLAVIEKAKQNGYSIVFETALRSESTQKIIIDVTKKLKEQKYFTKLSVLSVPKVEADISTLSRYCYYLNKYGECRQNTYLVPSALQDLRANIDNLTNLRIFDEITISVRGKNMDSLPIQIYSQQENKEISPLQAYDKGITTSFENTKINFYDRYKNIKDVLIEFKEYKKVELLEEIKQSFDKEMSEMR